MLLLFSRILYVEYLSLLNAHDNILMYKEDQSLTMLIESKVMSSPQMFTIKNPDFVCGWNLRFTVQLFRFLFTFQKIVPDAKDDVKVLSASEDVCPIILFDD